MVVNVRTIPNNNKITFCGLEKNVFALFILIVLFIELVWGVYSIYSISFI
jgi:hypothetical protein